MPRKCSALPAAIEYLSRMRFLSLVSSVWAARLFSGTLLLGAWGCSPLVPALTLAQLLPVPAVLAADSTLRLADSPLGRGLGQDWDSVLVVLPYADPAGVQALALANYGAVRDPVADQAYRDDVCLLLFVKAGRYTAYSRFPRTLDWVDFVHDRGPNASNAWLTPRQGAHLSAQGKAHAAQPASYSVRLAAR